MSGRCCLDMCRVKRAGGACRKQKNIAWDNGDKRVGAAMTRSAALARRAEPCEKLSPAGGRA